MHGETGLASGCQKPLGQNRRQPLALLEHRSILTLQTMKTATMHGEIGLAKSQMGFQKLGQNQRQALAQGILSQEPCHAMPVQHVRTRKVILKAPATTAGEMVSKFALMRVLCVLRSISIDGSSFSSQAIRQLGLKGQFLVCFLASVGTREGQRSSQVSTPLPHTLQCSQVMTL